MGLELILGARMHSDPPPEVHIRFTRLLSHLDEPHLLLHVHDTDGDSSIEAYFTKDDGIIIRQLRRLVSLGLYLDFGPAQDPVTTSAEDDPEPKHNLDPVLIPTSGINLDLSLLIALCSDITHAPLPSSEEDAQMRFATLSRRQRQTLGHQPIQIATATDDQGESRSKAADQDGKQPGPRVEETAAPALHPAASGVEPNANLGEHSRSLVAQVMQEVQRSLMDEIRDRCYPASSIPETRRHVLSKEEPLETATPVRAVSFWTTSEAKDRFLAIVDKIGGPKEKARSRALFGPQLGQEDFLAIEEFWKDSRFPNRYIPDLVPVRIHPHPAPVADTMPGSDLGPNDIKGDMTLPSPVHTSPRSAFDNKNDTAENSFHSRLRATCLDLLSSPPVPKSVPTPLSQTSSSPRPKSNAASSPKSIPKLPPGATQVSSSSFSSGFVPAQILKIGPSVRSGITPHTLRSLLLGVEGDLRGGVISSPLMDDASLANLETVDPIVSSKLEPNTIQNPDPIKISKRSGSIMTTLTANRSSVQTILRRMNVLFPSPLPSSSLSLSSLTPSASGTLEENGVIRIAEPRSLAECMRADF